MCVGGWVHPSRFHPRTRGNRTCRCCRSGSLRKTCMSLTTITSPDCSSRGRFSAHMSLLRLDHSVKQVFVIPGIVIAASLTGATVSAGLLYRIVLGLSAVVAVASSNYVLNELLDAPFDRLHPTKCMRPAALGITSVPLAYIQWLVCGLIGFVLAWQVSKPLFLVVL